MDAPLGASSFLASWTLQPDFEMNDCIRELVASQHASSRAFKELRGCLITDTEGIQHALKEVDVELHRVDAATKAFLPPRYFNELHGHKALTMPHRALSTAEILENIFLQVDLGDLLSLRKVNRKFRDIVKETQSLQQAMFLSPATDKLFRIPLRDSYNIDIMGASIGRPRLRISGRSSTNDPFNMPISNQTQVQIQIDGELDLFNIASMYRQMLACQPPLKEVTVESMNCCGSQRYYLRSYYDQDPVQEPLKVDSGITIGDLYDFAEQITTQHRLCPCGSVEMLDDKGLVHPEIKFSGTVDTAFTGLHNTCIVDPLGVAVDLTSFAPSPNRPKRSKKKKAHLEAYRVAKMLAAHNEVPIPTLKQYDKNRPYYESLSKPYWLDSMISRY